jgi:tRNA1(Val) A37 N6-methylase TrmN6
MKINSDNWTSDALTSRVRVAQRRGGHRYSFDDVVTAWVAARSAPAARTYLDLGCGLGSVLLMVADRLQHVRALGIEAQAESFALANHNVEQSWLAYRVRLLHGDLRDEALCERTRAEFASFVNVDRGVDASLHTDLRLPESLEFAREPESLRSAANRMLPSRGDRGEDALEKRARADLAGLANTGRGVSASQSVDLSAESCGVELGAELRRVDLVAESPRVEHTPNWRGFDLVTGTPPYKKPGTATPSPDPQRAHARIELRGGAEDYLATASKLLAPDGTCVVCMESAAQARVFDGARAAGLQVVEQLDVIPIAGETRKGRLFSVFTLKPGRGAAVSPRSGALVLRDASGARTDAALELRRFFGLEDPIDEAPSPPASPEQKNLPAFPPSCNSAPPAHKRTKEQS